MKPFLFTLSTALTLLFVACEKDKDDDPNSDTDVNEEFVMPTGEAAKVMGKCR